MWNRGDKLSAKNLNEKTRQIITNTGKSTGGGPSNSISGTNYLLFRQENLKMPKDGESFPYFWAPRPFVIFSGACWSGGTASLKIFTSNLPYPTTPLLEYTVGTDEEKFIDSSLDNFVDRGQYVQLFVVSSVSMSNFQFDLKIKVLA